MRRIIVVVAGLCITGASVASAAAPGPLRASLDVVQKWIYTYRAKPDPAHVPAAFRALIAVNAFKDPESAGIYVGFIAGAIGANPATADDLVGKLLPVPAEEQWVLVRAIAYSGLADWKGLMAKYADRLPTRRVMIDDYLAGKLPTLAAIPLEGPKPGFMDNVKAAFTPEQIFGPKQKPDKKLTFDKSPDLLDTLWGYYFASGAWAPILRITAMLPWANERNDVDKLTTGAMAKYTLASYAVRDSRLREFLKAEVKHEPKPTAAVLEEVIEAADTVQVARLRKDALAALEELKTKGPNSKRDMAFWGQVGVGTVAAGCVVAAALGQIEFGLPCVIGGSLSEGALNIWSKQQ